MKTSIYHFTNDILSFQISKFLISFHEIISQQLFFLVPSDVKNVLNDTKVTELLSSKV